MNVIQTKFKGVLIIEPRVHEDNRGFFMESYNKKTFEDNKIEYLFIQDNLSCSKEVGTLRGLHYQLNPKAQTKLITVLTGSVFDVVVDIRKSSVTFGQWIAVTLSADNKRQLIVPKGFAHGFCTLEPNTRLFYKVDELYSAEYERGILWNDPAIGIQWPTSTPILSVKDQNQPLLGEVETYY
ncbi:dTDP-4-dehydrorhamnose 3,5-epimerase [Paenibacillus gorillae]|uniref:dTDP-4-dehydrorhamnose 3,5-epimerase n=1 Tax=Paenibacillus gorillae TaxID=1243662 RepID=UPI0004BB4653|nr:dTDP-4-dehydrorhamnose 3,5-epimerase [Paenibacillus gorillae]